MAEAGALDADVDELTEAQAKAQLRHCQRLLAECVPMLHAGDEIPVCRFIEQAPHCLLARVAKASRRY